MITANGRPCSRISSGSSAAAQSGCDVRTPPRTRTTSTDRSASNMRHLTAMIPRMAKPIRAPVDRPPLRGVLENHHAVDRQHRRLRPARWRHRRLGAARAGVRLLRHLAARDQHGHDDRHLPDGVPHPAPQNKDSLAIHLKLNELVAAMQGASNRLDRRRGLSEKELRRCTVNTASSPRWRARKRRSRSRTRSRRPASGTRRSMAGESGATSRISAWLTPRRSTSRPTSISRKSTTRSTRRARKSAQRYDFKGAKADIDLNTVEKKLTLTTDDEMKMNALWEIVQTRLVRRGVRSRTSRLPNRSRRPAARSGA